MERLSGVDEYFRQKAKNSHPDIRNGLFRGFIPFHLKSTENFRFASTGRSVCDTTLLLVRHPDGSTHGVLSHFYSVPGYRRGHAELFDELDIPINPEDKVFALLLATTSEGSLLDQEEFENLKAAIARKNNGLDPDIVTVEKSTISRHSPSEIVFTQLSVKGGYEQTVEVTNSDYLRTFTYESPNRILKGRHRRQS